MHFTGRIIGITLIALLALGIRIYAYIYFDFPLSAPPIVGVICCFIAWWMGNQYDKAKFYSEKDSLTGLYNRRFIDKLFPTLLAQMDRRKAKLSISILDCDNFKVINDMYGHKKGDLVLQEFSSLLLSKTRKSDIVVRWGGDEFLIVAPFADEKHTEVIIGRYTHALQELSSKLQLEISCSSGYAIYPTDAKDMESLIQIADRKMYNHKIGSRGKLT
ncbi:MAG: diguanylate cyclase [Firmicutes bacterium]|nr:diguanylate cyclase [Bacillota bacterium]